MRRRFLCVILSIILLLPLLTGCEMEPVSVTLAPVGEAFFQAMILGNYGACYDLLARDMPDDLTRTSFIGTYTHVYDLIRLQELTWHLDDAEQIDANNAVLHYTLTYRCDLLPPFTQAIQMPISRSLGEWYVVWSPSLIFTDMDWGDRVLVSTLKQQRGEILDRDANAYALNSFGDTVYVRRSEVDNLQDISSRLAALLNMDAYEIREIIQAKTPEEDDYAVIHVYPPKSVDETLHALFTQIPSVGIDSRSFSPMRYYPQGSTFAHILGYTAPIQGEIDHARYDADSRVGVSGLERAYEDQLAGYRGREIALVDENGKKKAEPVFRLEPQNGLDLELTLDLELQLRAEALLAALPAGEQAGVIVAIDPKTGDLLAAASFPNYDPNMFSFPVPDALYQAMQAPESGNPFLSRATMGAYPPGSTIKPLIAAMALDNAVVAQDYEFKGTIDLAKRQWTPTVADWSGPPITRVSNYAGAVNFENAIVKSDNIFFADLALRAGWELMDPFLESLGFGQTFPFATSVSRSAIRVGGSTTNMQLLASSGYGQGEMLISPLQMAYTFSLFANGGSIMQPRLVSAMKTMNGIADYETVSSIAPSPLYENLVSQRSLDFLIPMLRKVVTQGSGDSGRVEGIETLGKTGTAEIGGNKEREIAWSISYVRGTDYERLVCVMLEVPTEPASAGAYRHTCVREMLAP